MTELLISGSVAVFASVTAPLILLHLSRRQSAADRKALWAREDAKETSRKAEAAEAARLQAKVAEDLAASQQKIAVAGEEAARLLAASNRAAAQDRTQVNSKLDSVIHTGDLIHALVNSDMTEARHSELHLARATVIVLERVIKLTTARGGKPSPEDETALVATRNRVAELEALMVERLRQAREAAAAAPIDRAAPTAEAQGGPHGRSARD